MRVTCIDADEGKSQKQCRRWNQPGAAEASEQAIKKITEEGNKTLVQTRTVTITRSGLDRTATQETTRKSKERTRRCCKDTDRKSSFDAALDKLNQTAEATTGEKSIKGISCLYAQKVTTALFRKTAQKEKNKQHTQTNMERREERKNKKQIQTEEADERRQKHTKKKSRIKRKTTVANRTTGQTALQNQVREAKQRTPTPKKNMLKELIENSQHPQR